MNNEIKEILDRLKDRNNYISHSMILLSIKETTLLLDYITNLQEENEDLREENKEAHDFDETMKDIKDNLIARINRQECEIHNLKEENERLKVELNKYIAKQKIETDIKMQQSYLDYYRTMTRGDK